MNPGTKIAWISTRFQKCKIAALVGAKNFLGIELVIASRWRFHRPLQFAGAAAHFRNIDNDVDATLLDRESDTVAVAHES